MKHGLRGPYGHSYGGEAIPAGVAGIAMGDGRDRAWHRLKTAARDRSRHASIGVATWWLLLLSPLAASSLVLRVAVYGALSFDAACKLLAGVVVIGVLAASLYVKRQWVDGWRALRSVDRHALGMVLLALALTVLATACLHRSDSDDTIYLPKLVHLLADPSTRMDGAIHELAGTPVLPRSAATYYPTSYEFAQAVVARVSGVNIFWIYYVLAPAMAGMVGLIALMLNIRDLGASTRAAAYAGLLFVPVLLLMGEAFRSYGNISLVRLFQSKHAFMWLGPPVFVYLSRVFLRTRDPRAWLALGVAVVALSGMTTTALVMLPLLAPTLLVACWVSREDVEGWLARAVAYALTLLPAVAFALDYRRYAVRYVPFGAAANAGFPHDFWGQVALLHQGVRFPLTWILFGGALCVCLCQGRRHRFLLTWMALLVLFVLNPWVATGVMRHVTSENIYWRLFYLLPFPLMLGVVLAMFYDRMLPGPRRTGWLGALVLACVIAVGVSPTSVMHPGNNLTVGRPGPSLDAVADDARRIAALAPTGVVLAPVFVAQDMAVLSVRHVQVATRPDLLALALIRRPLDDALRERAVNFVGGYGGSLADLVPALQRYRPRTVVVAAPVVSPALIRTLVEFNLHRAGAVDGWQVYTTTAESPASPAPLLK